MHPCLYVHDIIELVARFAEDNAGPSSVLALVKTCRTFYEPASNIRWRRLKSLNPLLNLFFTGESASLEVHAPI